MVGLPLLCWLPGGFHEIPIGNLKKNDDFVLATSCWMAIYGHFDEEIDDYGVDFGVHPHMARYQSRKILADQAF